MAQTTPTPVVVITGASSGIGAETALAFARRGAGVVLAARRADRLAALVRDCQGVGGVAIGVTTDVAEADQVQALVAAAVEQFGRIDVMVNNAGYGQFGRVHELSDEDMRRIFDVNFFGVFYGCKAAAPVMIRQRSGHIFNISSIIGKRGSPFHGAYCATKFAVAGLTDSMRVELAHWGVRVTLVCPALTETQFSANVRDGEPRSESKYLTRAAKMPARKVALKIVEAVGKRRPQIVFTAGGKFLVAVNALWPSAADRIMKYYHDDLLGAIQRTNETS
ncbi:MAG: SDR family oxidoreductase [Phycisphaerae bacterium]|nr:SDR family oxidoreductase [Phycisphaerae bacterium]